MEHPTDTLRPAVPCSVRELIWRSFHLEQAFVTQDDYKARLTASIPKNSQGRPPRPRYRLETRPASPLEPPTGLPVDCYSLEWLNTLTARKRGMLEIEPTPILPQVLQTLNSL